MSPAYRSANALLVVLVHNGETSIGRQRVNTATVTFAVALAGVLVGCGAARSSSRTGVARVLTVDVERGTVGGVGLGSSRKEIERRFGRARPYSQAGGGKPIKAGEIEEEGWPWIVAPPREPKPLRPTDLRRAERLYREVITGTMRYDRLVFDTVPRVGAYYAGVADRRMLTREGVRYGDTLKSVRERYPFLRCGIRNEDSEYAPYPYCTGRAARGVYVWFGQDPLRSISFASRPMG